MKTLTEAELSDLLRAQPDWKLYEGKLVRDWTFPDFVQAIAFVNQVAALAEAAGHHPDIDVKYNRVRLGLISHDAGGITNRDGAMAKRIDSELSAKLGK
jgi:4a-hydroxytetrahydrobiopterin dehydratase